MRTAKITFALLAGLVTAVPFVLANTTPAQRGEPNTTAAQRAQAAERDDDFDEWGLLGLLGLAGLLGLRRRKDERDDPTVYTTRPTTRDHGV